MISSEVLIFRTTQVDFAYLFYLLNLLHFRLLPLVLVSFVGETIFTFNQSLVYGDKITMISSRRV